MSSTLNRKDCGHSCKYTVTSSILNQNLKSKSFFFHFSSLVSYHSIDLLSFSAKLHEKVVYTWLLPIPLLELSLSSQQGFAPVVYKLFLARSPMTSTLLSLMISFHGIQSLLFDILHLAPRTPHSPGITS